MTTAAEKNAAKRELVELEMITTEKKYCMDLNIFLDVFIRPLVRLSRTSPRPFCVTTVEASVLECNFEKVLQCSKELIRQMDLEKSGGQSQQQQPRTFGRVFMDESERIRKAYVEFVSGYRAALDLHADLMDRRKPKGAKYSYHHFIKKCADSNDGLVGGRIFTDFFILPIQRIPRYRLFLEELLRRVPSRYERAFVKEALKRITIVADEMNYRLRQTVSERRENGPRKVATRESSESEDEDQLDTIEEETEDDTISTGDDHHHLLHESIDESATENGSENGTTNGDPHPPAIAEESEDEATAGDSVELTPNSKFRKEHAKEIRVENWLESRSWKGANLINAPTSNSFALYALAVKGNPWKASELSHYNASSLSARLLELYSYIKTPAEPYKPAAGDVVVIGPVRSGQTCVLQALECYSLQTFTRNPHSILNHVGFVAWEDWNDIPTMRFRILKAHAELKIAFGGMLNPSLKMSRPSWRVIATLRHPADLRISFFRHVRRMFRKMNPELNFDRMAMLDEFANCMADYESFVADVIKVNVEMESTQLLVVFYEEMASDPVKTLERIANFIEFKIDNPEGKKSSAQLAQEREQFIQNVSLGLTSSAFFVGYSSRVGSINQGKAAFSRAVLTKMESEWESKIKAKYSQFPTYEKLFCVLTGKDKYPYETSTTSSENGGGETSSHGSMRKSKSFTLFNRSRKEGMSISRENSTIRSEDNSEASAHGGPLPSPRGFLARLTSAFSVSHHDPDDAPSIFEGLHGTSKDKSIDPDDSDEEFPEDLINYWSQEVY